MTVEEFDIETALDDASIHWTWGETIGGSTIGNDCDAFIQFAMRSFPTFDEQRKRRIFSNGHVSETRLIAELKAKFDVVDKDPTTGKQYVFKAYGGHVKVKLDGIIRSRSYTPGTPYSVLEIKGAKQEIFRDVVKNFMKDLPYSAQLQMNMLLSGLTRAVLVIENKNTQELRSWVFDADPIQQGFIKAKIEKQFRPGIQRMARDESHFLCKMCKFKRYCWDGHTAPAVATAQPYDCQQCIHSLPDPNGGWVCDLNGAPATKRCENYKQWLPNPKE